MSRSEEPGHVNCQWLSSRILWRVSFAATRAAMPNGIMTLALVYAVPGLVVLAASARGSNWISLMTKMRHVLGSSEAAA